MYSLTWTSLIAASITASAWAAGLSPIETRIAARVDEQAHKAETFLEKVVNINSGSMNHEGVRRVGEIYDREFAALGFATRWIEMPEEMGRAGHLFAEIDGSEGNRVLLIGHLDTVFEADSSFQTFIRDGDTVFGPGTEDMKGGNTVILFALKALHAEGALENRRVIVALTGDEEMPGSPIDLARRDLLEAGRRSDFALGFEAGVRNIRTATVARRGSSSWSLEIKGTRAHSSQIFDDAIGAGAIYEASRILNAFYSQIRGERYLTFNPGVILGGTTVDYDSQEHRGSAFGKSNVIAEIAKVDGDLRFISEEQKQNARDRMRAIVAQSSPGTSAEITFRDGYPAMSPTEGNDDLLRKLNGVSLDLGYGEVEPLDPGERGAADISFVAADVKGSLDGLGPVGWHGHTVDERIDITTMAAASKKAAILIFRLIHSSD